MNEGIPAAPSNEAKVERVTMNEAETIAALEQQGLERLDLDAWQPGEPLLYVLHDEVREGTGMLRSPMRDLPEEGKPSLARMNAPTFMIPDPNSKEGEDLYQLGNEDGGQVDYYAIDRETAQPRFLRTGNTVKPRNNPYSVSKKLLFKPNDALFPKQKVAE